MLVSKGCHVDQTSTREHGSLSLVDVRLLENNCWSNQLERNGAPILYCFFYTKVEKRAIIRCRRWGGAEKKWWKSYSVFILLVNLFWSLPLSRLTRLIGFGLKGGKDRDRGFEPSSLCLILSAWWCVTLTSHLSFMSPVKFSFLNIMPFELITFSNGKMHPGHLLRVEVSRAVGTECRVMESSLHTGITASVRPTEEPQ